MTELVDCEQIDFERLLTGPVDQAQTVTIDQHIESCSACQRRLQETAGSARWWSECRETLRAVAGDEGLSAPHPSSAFLLSERTREDSSRTIEAVLSAPSHPEMLGRIGRYDVEQFLGSGGMGMVFKGFDSELNRPVAVKVLAPHLAGSGVARQRFAREARAAASIVHEHVVSIHDVQAAATADVPFLVMQYVPGHSLQEFVERDGALEPREVVRIGRQIAAGLEAAHAQGVIHRDIKPANIMLENDLGRVVITDFGLAQAADDYSLTRTGTLAGTPHYMSPEQAESETVDHRTDLFSLGSVMYFMATGRPPFRASRPLGVLHRICRDEPTPVQVANPDVPMPLAVCIDRLLAKAPDERPPSAAAVRRLLGEYLAHLQQPTTVPLPAALRKGTRHRDRRTSGWLVAGVCAVVMMAIAGLWPARPDAKSEHVGDPGGADVTESPPVAAGAPPLSTPPIMTELIPLQAFDQELDEVRQAVEALEQPSWPEDSTSGAGHWDLEADTLEQEISELERVGL